MHTVTITDLEELHDALFESILRKYGNYPPSIDTKKDARHHAEKQLKKWVEKNCTPVTGNTQNLWKMYLELPNDSLFIHIFRRYSVFLEIDDEGVDLVPIFGNFLFG